jgi:hypothetical protein
MTTPNCSSFKRSIDDPVFVFENSFFVNGKIVKDRVLARDSYEARDMFIQKWNLHPSTLGVMYKLG